MTFRLFAAASYEDPNRHEAGSVEYQRL